MGFISMIAGCVCVCVCCAVCVCVCCTVRTDQKKKWPMVLLVRALLSRNLAKGLSWLASNFRA